MPRLARPDGAELHWRERGSGPLVVGAFSSLSMPAVFSDLLEDLARDHRVVTYDPRGTGDSTPGGPYDRATDTADLEALLDHLGGGAVVVATGDACNRAVRVCARRPDLVAAIVTAGGNPLGRTVTEGSEALAASDSVLDLLVTTLRTDYRAALHTAVASANPQLDEEGVRRRVDEMVEYAPQDVTLARVIEWIGDVAEEEALAAGDRLWMLEHEHNPWFPVELVERTRRRLPAAHVEIVEDGALSRPDITAAIVRRLTGARRSA